MEIYNFQPSFYDNPLVIFNYCIQDLLKKVISENSKKLEIFDGYEVLNYGRELTIVNIKQEMLDLLKPECRNYLSELREASSNNGVFANIRGNNTFAYAEQLSRYTSYSIDDIFKIYHKNFKNFEDEQKTNFENELSLWIPKLYNLTIENKQYKTDSNSELKGYCDLDFYSYIYNDVFMIACYASATMYAIKFNENGFKVYGQNNDYGKEIELKNDPDFDWDNTGFEDYFLKHMNENMLILEVNKNGTNSFNELISMFHNIVKFICKEERIIQDKIGKFDDIEVIFEDEPPIVIARRD